MPARVKLRDGTRIALRPVHADDKELLRGAFDRLSETSRYRRFFTPISELDDATLAYLTEIDHHDHEAIVGLDPQTGEAIGVARFVRAPPGSDAAEAAVVVVDDWQSRGVGRALTRRLARRARQEGVHWFTAEVKAENPHAIELLHGLGPTEMTRDGAEVHVLIELPKRGMGARLARALRAAATDTRAAADTLTQKLAGRDQ
jgi:RimJ/RimL family protein N-acetyltransferase